MRDGKSAVILAETAVAADGRQRPWFLGTLGAAYAETEQFHKAVITQREAIKLLQHEEQKAKLESRLFLYEAGKPCLRVSGKE